MATAAAAVAARAHREVRDFFTEKDALDPGRAVEFKPEARIQQRYLEQLLAEGVVHEVRPGFYWLDLPAYGEMRRQRLAWSLKILVLLAVAIALFAGVQAALGCC
jgi:hypothetical protein